MARSPPPEVTISTVLNVPVEVRIEEDEHRRGRVPLGGRSSAGCRCELGLDRQDRLPFDRNRGRPSTPTGTSPTSVIR